MRVRTHTNPFSFLQRFVPFELEALFETPDNPLDFEIGFGRGVFLREWAGHHPNHNIIGVEVRPPMVDLLAQRIKDLNLRNAHVLQGNAQTVLADAVADDSISNCFIFHPDPWFKARHHKRRIINPSFLSLLEKKLKLRGKLYISTDVEELHDYMKEMVSRYPSFVCIEDDSFWTVDYKTHWSEFTVAQNKPVYCLTFQRII